jgi:hypothetical protein
MQEAGGLAVGVALLLGRHSACGVRLGASEAVGLLIRDQNKCESAL